MIVCVCVLVCFKLKRCVCVLIAVYCLMRCALCVCCVCRFVRGVYKSVYVRSVMCCLLLCVMCLFFGCMRACVRVSVNTNVCDA